MLPSVALVMVSLVLILKPTDEQLRYQKEADTARKELKQYVSEYDTLAASYVSLQNKLNAMPDAEEDDDDA